MAPALGRLLVRALNRQSAHPPSTIRASPSVPASRSGTKEVPDRGQDVSSCTGAGDAWDGGDAPQTHLVTQNSAGGRAVAGSNPVSPIAKSPAYAGLFGSCATSSQVDPVLFGSGIRWISPRLRPVNAGLAAAQPRSSSSKPAHDVQPLPRPRPRGPSAAPWSALARTSVDVTYVLHRAVVGA